MVAHGTVRMVEISREWCPGRCPSCGAAPGRQFVGLLCGRFLSTKPTVEDNHEGGTHGNGTYHLCCVPGQANS